MEDRDLIAYGLVAILGLASGAMAVTLRRKVEARRKRRKSRYSLEQPGGGF